MTFLEVIFSIMILLVLAMTAASLIRNGVDLQMSLSQQAKVSHGLSVAMKRLTSDLQHAFLIDRKRLEYFFSTRKMKTYFEVKTRGNNSTLMLTAMNNQARMMNAQESDQTFIVYRVERDDTTGLSNLLRGQTKYIPERFRERDVPTEVLAKNIRALRIKPWDGNQFRNEWNSDKAEWRDKLPYMVEVEIEAYEVDLIDEERVEDESQTPYSTMRTVIYIPRARGKKQRRDPSSQPKRYE